MKIFKKCLLFIIVAILSITTVKADSPLSIEGKEYGEWYGYLHRDGTVSHTQKGSLWKGPYHLPRCLMLCELILDSIIDESNLPELL